MSNRNIQHLTFGTQMKQVFKPGNNQEPECWPVKVHNRYTTLLLNLENG